MYRGPPRTTCCGHNGLINDDSISYFDHHFSGAHGDSHSPMWLSRMGAGTHFLNWSNSVANKHGHLQVVEWLLFTFSPTNFTWTCYSTERCCDWSCCTIAQEQSTTTKWDTLALFLQTSSDWGLHSQSDPAPPTLPVQRMNHVPFWAWHYRSELHLPPVERLLQFYSCCL